MVDDINLPKILHPLSSADRVKGIAERHAAMNQRDFHRHQEKDEDQERRRGGEDSADIGGTEEREEREKSKHAPAPRVDEVGRKEEKEIKNQKTHIDIVV